MKFRTFDRRDDGEHIPVEISTKFAVQDDVCHRVTEFDGVWWTTNILLDQNMIISYYKIGTFVIIGKDRLYCRNW